MVTCEFSFGVEDLKDYCRMIKRLVAELLGMFIYITLLFSGIFSVYLFPFTNGFLMASVLICIRPISGGHLNPAITLGSSICCFINLIPAILYIIAQICGALLGQLLAKAISKSSILTLKETELAPLLILELLKTFLVVAVALSVSERPFTVMRIGPLAVGMCIAACMTTTTDYRALMNPAASLAASMFYGDFSLHWVSWVGPILGAILAGVFHLVLFKPRPVLTTPTRPKPVRRRRFGRARPQPQPQPKPQPQPQPQPQLQPQPQPQQNVTVT